MLCVIIFLILFVFFFFQAEDGIRDYKVTGVQTCALPISDAEPRHLRSDEQAHPPVARLGAGIGLHEEREARAFDRSEERRVGKECRARWWTVHSNNSRIATETHTVCRHYYRLMD